MRTPIQHPRDGVRAARVVLRGDVTRTTRDRPVRGAGVSLLALLVGCDFSGPQSALDPAGPFARSIAGHWWLMFWTSAAVFLIVVALFLYAIRGARRAHPIDELPADAGDDDVTASAKLRAVTTGVIITIIILVTVMVQALFVSRETYAAGTRPALADVEIVGHRWWWEVRYRDPDPAREFASANELHIPVGQPVRIRLRSNDVIHSFWVPNLQGKIDLIPGRENDIRIQADAPGEWRGQCAEFCGLQHARMAFVVVAHEPGEFAAWREQALQPVRPPADSLARQGERVFQTSQCAYCHAVRGTRAAGRAGPDLTHLASRRTLGAGTLPNTRGHLAGWILDPQASKPGTLMPPTPLDGPDLQALLFYLGTLR